MPASTSPAERLKQIQDFMDGRFEGEPSSVLLEYGNFLDDPRAPGGIKARLVLHGMQSVHGRVREAAVQQADAMFSGGKSREMLNELLGYAMEDYRDDDHARAVLIRLMLAELRANRHLWPHETVKFVVNLRRVFEIPYSESFARDCVACLFLLMADKARDPSGALAQLSFDRMLTALRSGMAPDPTIAAIKTELGMKKIEEVDPAFVAAVRDNLPGEVNPQRVAGSLDLLARWYRPFSLKEHPDVAALGGRLTSFYRGEKVALETLDVRLLEANGDMVGTLADLVVRWPKSARIGRNTVRALCRLSSARRLIRDEDPLDWPLFLRRWDDPERPHFFEMSLAYFRHFVFGIGANLDRKEERDEEVAPGKTYGQILDRVNKWANLEADREVLARLEAMMADIHAPLAMRREALACLADIHPTDLEQRCLRFARAHPVEDLLVPELLATIAKRPSWDFWPVCEHYFELFRPGTAWPLIGELIEAAGATGNSEMTSVLVPFAFDDPRQEIREAARKAIVAAGYEVYLDRERITRLLRRILPERDEAFERLQGIYQETDLRFKDQSAGKRDLSEVRFGMEDDNLELRQRTTKFRAFSTDKLIVLAEVDKQLEELTEKIAHLTERKNELHRAKDELMRRRDSLISSLREVEAETARVNRDIDRLRREIADLQERIRQLERERQRLSSELDNRKRECDNVHDREERANQRRVAQHRDLERERRQCMSDISRLDNTISQLMRSQSRLEGSVRSVRGDISTLNSRIRAEPADSPRRSSLVSQRRSLESRAKSLDGEIRDVRSNMREADHRRNSIQRRVGSIQNECSKLDREVAQSHEIVSQAERQVASAAQAVSDNEAQIRRTGNEVQARTSAVNQLKRRRAALEEEAERLERQIAVLQREEARLEQELIPVIRDLEDAKREYQRINRRREQEENEIQAERNRAEALRQTIRDKIDAHERQFDAIHERICQLDARIAALQADHTHWTGRFEDLVQQIRDHKAELETLCRYCEEATVEKNKIAYTRTILARFERDRQQIRRLHYARTIDLAAARLAREGADEP